MIIILYFWIRPWSFRTSFYPLPPISRAALPFPLVYGAPASSPCPPYNKLPPLTFSVTKLLSYLEAADTICTMASNSRRPFSIDGPPAPSLPHSGAHATAPSTPSLSNNPQFPMAQVPRPAGRHARAQSYTPQMSNRLSLSFPVAANNSGSDIHPSPASSASPPLLAPAADAVPPSPNDSNNFLVALAGQERRVLELREELQKAETELASLKVQWASRERARKRAEIRHVQPLQSLQTVVTDGARSSEDADGSSPTRQSIELDRRKALLSNMAKEPRRKVITGGHARTLSLLSPDRSNFTQPFPPVQESVAESREAGRGITIPDTSKGITKIRSRHSYQGGVTDNARQIAVDMKAGLWTFLEDLRQATVGDEPINGKPNRTSLDSPRTGPKRNGSKSNLLNNERPRDAQSPNGDSSTRTWDSLTGTNSILVDAGGTYFVDARNAPGPTATANEDAAKVLADADELDDSWGNWDSPIPVSPRWSGSTELSGPATPSTNNNTSNRSVK
jgi:hypothetical protein